MPGITWIMTWTRPQLALACALAGQEYTPATTRFLPDLPRHREVLQQRAAHWSGGVKPKRLCTAFLNAMDTSHWIPQNARACPGLQWVADVCREIQAQAPNVRARAVEMFDVLLGLSPSHQQGLQNYRGCRTKNNPWYNGPSGGPVRKSLHGRHPRWIYDARFCSE